MKWENTELGVLGSRFSRGCFQFNVRFRKGLVIFKGGFLPSKRHEDMSDTDDGSCKQSAWQV